MELLDHLLDIAALLELEAQAFRYTRNNITLLPDNFTVFTF